MPLLTLYAAMAAGVGLVSALRRETTLVRGRTVLAVHASFAVAQAVWMAGPAEAGVGAPVGQPPVAGAGTLALFVALAALSIPLCGHWLLSGFDEASFRGLVERSLRQLRIPFEAGPSGYMLVLREGAARLSWRTAGSRRALVRLEHDARDARKVDLLRSLLAKRLGRLLPRPRIRFD